MNFQEKVEMCLKWHLRTLIWLLVHQHVPACHFSMAELWEYSCSDVWSDCGVGICCMVFCFGFPSWWPTQTLQVIMKIHQVRSEFCFHGSKTRELSLTFNSTWSQLLNLMNSRCGRRLQHGTMSLTISQSHLQTVSRRNLSETRSPRGMTTPRCCPVAESGHAATWWPHLSCWALSKARLTVECFVDFYFA